ncbi:MAG TPA: hypothetical protein PLH24_04765 [Candidatus Atribacteria bacterium]|nr:hypothetical protein [Candidatus Atribacteria bacterium]
MKDGSIYSRREKRGGEELLLTKPGAFLKGNTDVLEKLTIEMYTRGLSTKRLEDALLKATEDWRNT